MTPRDMLAKLVSFDTTSAKSNLELIHFVANYLEGFGIASDLVFDDGGGKANVYATVGPKDVADGVILSGHTDVVPVQGQPWSSDPFILTERDGKLYGRGTCDMKGFIALALSTVAPMDRTRLKRPIHFAFSYDEEVGCIGAPRMIAAMAKHLPQAQRVIVGEPTLMKVVSGHKGIGGYRTKITGHEVHSSLCHSGVSAVTTAARLITQLDDWMRDNAFRADQSSLFTPPFTTVHVGMVKGGTALNITARDCEFVWDVRALPEEHPKAYRQRFERYCKEEVLPALQRVHPETQIVTEILAETEALTPESDGRAESLCRHLTGCDEQHRVAYATEGGQFQSAGFSAVVCGPGSIEQAHQADEYIELSQMAAGEAFLKGVIEHQCRAEG